MANKYLDQQGLIFLWSQIKSKFVKTEEGKGLSSNDYTTADKTKLAGLSPLSPATSTTLGGVKIGEGLSVTADGTVKATVTADVNFYTGDRAEGESDIDVITRVIGSTVVHDGDIFVIRTLIHDTKYSYTAFVYDQTWKAMDGNYDAENVYMRSDIITAGSYTQVGNITKGQSATGSIATAGKNIKEVFQAIFTKELNPTTTQPSVSITLSGAGAKEVGTTFTPSYSASLNAGSYTYGPPTGITAKTWAISDTNSKTATTASGQLEAFVVADNTNYRVSATATYDAGAIPKTNLGNNYTAGQIAAGSKSNNSSNVTGFRKYFYGSKTTPVALNSANIRGLTNSSGAVGSSKTFDMTIAEGAKQVIIAFPASTNKTLKKVLDVGAFGTDIVASFTMSTVSVEGAAGYTGVDYKVYVYTPATALGANTYTVTIS